jgi:hypothetical protein
MADEAKPTGTQPQAPTQAAQQGQQQPQFPTDTSSISTVYTNFCHVSITPEELILDFGLNTQMTPTPTEAIKLTHRVVMNFYTAKRLMNALHFAVSRHESAFGALELDFNKRVRNPQGMGGGAPGGGMRPGGGGFAP